MALALGTTAVVLVVLLWELTRPRLSGATDWLRAFLVSRRQGMPQLGYDPGRERRAELRARALLRSCIEDDDWAMYDDLGFLRVWGGLGERGAKAPYAYLIYPHKPIVAYLPSGWR